MKEPLFDTYVWYKFFIPIFFQRWHFKFWTLPTRIHEDRLWWLHASSPRAAVVIWIPVWTKSRTLSITLNTLNGEKKIVLTLFGDYQFFRTYVLNSLVCGVTLRKKDIQYEVSLKSAEERTLTSMRKYLENCEKNGNI